MDGQLTDVRISSVENSPTSVPETASETSRGSSVSSDLQREYEDILKYAIVTPRFDTAIPNLYQPPEGNMMPRPEKNLSTIAEVSSIAASSSTHITDDDEKGGMNEIINENANVSSSKGLPTLLGRDELYEFVNDERHRDRSLSSRNSSSSPTIPEHFDDNIDVDLVRMESLMDEWCLQLKRNVLSEFGNSKLRQLEAMKQELERHKKRHDAEEDALRNQIENQNELLHAFEKSIHQKDIVITNLTNTVQKQRDKQEKLKVLLTWKLRSNDEKRENFASKLAEKHYKRSILTKTWLGWRTVIEMRWKQRVERACQARSQEICIKLTEDYEERLKALQQSLEIARAEIANLHSERDNYEETMKKAFMRGVCALNMEAMNMFKEKSNDQASESSTEADSQHRENKTSETSLAKNSINTDSRSKRISEANGVDRPIHVKAVGRSSFGNKSLRNERPGKAPCQPKLASVFVEKHNTGQQLHSHIDRPKQISFDDIKKMRKIDDKRSAQSIKVVE